jgi:hypothetical protein
MEQPFSVTSGQEQGKDRLPKAQNARGRTENSMALGLASGYNQRKMFSLDI